MLDYEKPVFLPFRAFNLLQHYCVFFIIFLIARTRRHSNSDIYVLVILFSFHHPCTKYDGKVIFSVCLSVSQGRREEGVLLPCSGVSLPLPLPNRTGYPSFLPPSPPPARTSYPSPGPGRLCYAGGMPLESVEMAFADGSYSI